MKYKIGKKAIVTKELEVSAHKDIPDYTGPRDFTLNVGDKLSLIDVRDDLEEETIYIFSVYKLQETGASAVEFYEDEFEFIDD